MTQEKNNNKNLSSWKEIADFLGVSERTAQHWEQERGLPVKRLAGSKGRVSANVADLELWQKNNLKAAPWYSSLRFLRYYGAFATALFLLAIGILTGIYLANRKGPPAECRLEYKTLIVTDSRGQELWRKPLDAPLAMGAYEHGGGTGLRTAWFGKINQGDKGISVLFPYYPITADKTGAALICYSQTGDEMWRFATDRTVSENGETYPPTYVISDYHVQAVSPGGPNRIMVTSHHTYGNANQFAILDGERTVLSEYWHSGHLPYMEVEDFDGDGINEVFLAGVNNGLGCAVMQVLKSNNVQGAYSQPDGDKTQLNGFGPGTEMATVLFPRTCIRRRSLYNQVTMLSVQRDAIKVDVAEAGSDYLAVVIYRFGKNLERLRPIVSDYWKDLHAAIRAKGELDHDFSESEVDELAKNISINNKKDPK